MIWKRVSQSASFLGFLVWAVFSLAGLGKALFEKLLIALLERPDIVALLAKRFRRLEAAGSGGAVEIQDLVLGQIAWHSRHFLEGAERHKFRVAEVAFVPF